MKAVLRLRLKVPGHGAKIARLMGLHTVSQTGKITQNNKEASIYRSGSWPIACNEIKTLINYGVAHDTEFLRWWRMNGCRIVNDPIKTAKASDKVECLRILSAANVPTLDWKEMPEDARVWAHHGSRVFCRTLTRAKKGNGIVIASTPDEVVKAPLYTKEYKKTHEHRVHVFKNKDGVYEIIDFVQKKRCERLAKDGVVNDDIRNKQRGWYFSHENRVMSKHIKQACLDAAKALDLDYCAIDVLSIWETKSLKTGTHRKFISCAICEVNTAPGMTAQTTLDAYINAFKSL